MDWKKSELVRQQTALALQQAQDDPDFMGYVRTTFEEQERAKLKETAGTLAAMHHAWAEMRKRDGERTAMTSAAMISTELLYRLSDDTINTLFVDLVRTTCPDGLVFNGIWETYKTPNERREYLRRLKVT